MKELTVRQIAAVKRQFRNSLPALNKIKSIDKKIADLEEEKAIQMAILEGGEAGIMAMTGGYKSIDLIKCEYIPQFNEDGSPKMDKEGKYQVRNQVLTFIPPVEEVEDKIVENEVEVPVTPNQYDEDTSCVEDLPFSEKYV